MTNQPFDEKSIPFFEYVSSCNEQLSRDGVNLGFLLSKGEPLHLIQ